jgi:hypothetical protein
VKNTAIGSHAGPVGSITTSNPCPQPLRPGPPARPPSNSKHSARSGAGTPPAPSRRDPAPYAPSETSRPRSQGGRARLWLPLRCCKRVRPQGRPTSLIRGIRGQASGGNQIHGAFPQNPTQRHPPDQPGCSCNPGTPRRSSSGVLCMNPRPLDPQRYARCPTGTFAEVTGHGRVARGLVWMVRLLYFAAVCATRRLSSTGVRVLSVGPSWLSD